jgi:alpha-beta hydrolase superfamily lysophospholipase
MTGIGGRELYGRSWVPETPHRGVIALAHGLGEHSGRYAKVAQDLVARGYSVHAIDHRGHGRSAGSRANIERFEYVVADVCALAEAAVRRHPGRPVFLLGHSMGGAIALAAAARMQSSLRGLVLSAPALAIGDNGGPAWQRFVARLLSVCAPNAGVLKLDPRLVSRDPAVVHAYEEDPLVHHRAVPARTAVELLTAMQRFTGVAAQLQLPVLILHGTADRLVPLTPTLPVHAAIAPRLLTFKQYDGLYHEVLNEPERARVLVDLLAWLDERVDRDVQA